VVWIFHPRRHTRRTPWKHKPAFPLIDLVIQVWLSWLLKIKDLGVCKFESITRTLEQDCFISSLRPGLFHTSRCGDFQELLASLLWWGFQWPLRRLPAMVNALQASPKCEFTLTSLVDRQWGLLSPISFIVIVPLIAHGPPCGQGLDYFPDQGLLSCPPPPCFRGKRI
jgi:hypothetical protein